MIVVHMTPFEFADYVRSILDQSPAGMDVGKIFRPGKPAATGRHGDLVYAFDVDDGLTGRQAEITVRVRNPAVCRNER